MCDDDGKLDNSNPSLSLATYKTSRTLQTSGNVHESGRETGRSSTSSSGIISNVPDINRQEEVTVQGSAHSNMSKAGIKKRLDRNTNVDNVYNIIEDDNSYSNHSFINCSNHTLNQDNNCPNNNEKTAQNHIQDVECQDDRAMPSYRQRYNLESKRPSTRKRCQTHCIVLIFIWITIILIVIASIYKKL